MTVPRAIVAGWKRALSAPWLILGLWLTALLVALPAGLLMQTALADGIGASAVHERLRDGYDMAWSSEMRHRGGDLVQTLEPSTVTPAAMLDNLEAWFSGRLFEAPRALLALGVLFGLLWIFLAGGALRRLRPGAKRGSRRFLADGADLFPRFLRLSILGGLAYYGIYRLSRWLFPWIEEATRDLTVEKTVLLYNLLGAALIVLLLTAVNMIFDYARIATVVERRRSMLAAVWRALRFVGRHPLATLGVYWGLALSGALLLALYWLAAPGTGYGSVAGVLWAALLGQAYLASRVALRLAFLGGQTHLFETFTLSRQAQPVERAAREGADDA